MSLKPKSVVKSIATLILGNSFAEIIVLLSYPVVSRLYTPHDFGEMTVLWACCTLLAAMACWRMENVIVIEKSYIKARKVADICVFGAYFLAILVLTALFILPKSFYSQYLSSEQLNILLWAVPATILASGLHLMLSNWAVRLGNFRIISLSRMVAVFNSTVIKITYGFINGSSSVILLICNILSILIQVIVLLPYFIKGKLYTNRASIKDISAIEVIREYKSFPTVQLATTFMTSLTFNLPNIFLALFYTSEVVGYFGFAFAVLMRPVMVIADSIAKVLLKDISITNPNKRVQHSIKLTGFIALSVSPLFLIFGYYAIPIFSLYFGEQWAEAGYFSQLLLIWLFGRIIIIPMSQLIIISKLLSFNFWYTFIQSISRLSVIVILGWMEFGADIVIAIYAITGFFLQIIYILFSAIIAMKYYKRIDNE